MYTVLVLALKLSWGWPFQRHCPSWRTHQCGITASAWIPRARSRSR